MYFSLVVFIYNNVLVLMSEITVCLSFVFFIFNSVLQVGEQVQVGVVAGFLVIHLA